MSYLRFDGKESDTTSAPQKLVCNKRSNSSSKRRKDVDEQRQQPQEVEDQNRGLKVQVALLRAELVSLITVVRSLTVDIETQMLENYVLQKEVQMVKDRPVRVNVPAVATYH